MRQTLHRLAPLLLGLTLACGQGAPTPPASEVSVQVSPGGVAVQGDAGRVQASPGGVDVQGDGGRVQASPGGVDVQGDGGRVQVDSGGVDVQGDGGRVQASPGGVDVQGDGGRVQASPGGVDVQGDGGRVQASPGGVDVQGDGGRVQVDSGGVDVQGDGGSVQMGPGGVSVQGDGANVQVGPGGVSLQGVPGVDLAGVPGVGSVDAGMAVDVGVYLQGLDPVELPEITVPGVEVRHGKGRTIYFLSGDVLFDFDKADLRPDAREALKQVARSLSERHSGATVLVEGYTDAKGSDEYNRKLSLRRAESVRRWLAGPGGLAGAKVEVKGRGEANPVAANTRPDGSDDPDGRQRNRRVEISVPD